MILFIFEGQRREPRLFESIKKLFFIEDTDTFVCTYNSNIYSLYNKLKQYDVFDGIHSSGRTVPVLKEILKNNKDNTLNEIEEKDISEIFLFFDYDFHEKRFSLYENNNHIKEMLEFFNEETESGKLYINYPMVESIQYTKKLPDENFINYTIMRNQCACFKNLTRNFSYYGSLDHLLISNNHKESSEKKNLRFKEAKSNWKHLIYMNVTKANYICNNEKALPKSKKDIAQRKLFEAQLIKYVNSDECKVAILNSFPIFIYEYLNVNNWSFPNRNSKQIWSGTRFEVL